MNSRQWDAMGRVLQDVSAERERQHAKWGERNIAHGTGDEGDAAQARAAQQICDHAAAAGTLTYRDILREEFYEAVAEADPDALRKELVQVAAVAVAWAEMIDRANHRQTHEADPGSTAGATVGAGEGGDAPAGSYDANGSPVEGGG